MTAAVAPDCRLVVGATGCIGGALVASLAQSGVAVVAGTRRADPSASASANAGASAGTGTGTGASAAATKASAPTARPKVTWRTCDVLRPETLPEAMQGVQVAYYLVHSMGRGAADGDYAARDVRAAQHFVAAAQAAGVERIVYLGGPQPNGPASPHLESRLAVGRILRSSPVPTVELRASMVIAAGSTSWQIVRDLAMRLPLMILPRWLRSQTQPVALQDVVVALQAAAQVPLPQGSAWFDIPGPEALNGRQILERIAALDHRRIRTLELPVLSPRLSALWLRLVTRADFAVAKELVAGLTQDTLPSDGGRIWEQIGHTQLLSFDEAARRALEAESRQAGLGPSLVRMEERCARFLSGRPRGAGRLGGG